MPCVVAAGTCHTNMTIECLLLQVSFLVVRFRVIQPMVPYSSRERHPTQQLVTQQLVTQQVSCLVSMKLNCCCQPGMCTWMSVSLGSDMSTYVSDVSDCVKDVLVSRTYLDVSVSVSCHVSVMKLSGCHCQECVCLCRCEGSVKNASGRVNNVVSGSVNNVVWQCQ